MDFPRLVSSLPRLQVLSTDPQIFRFPGLSAICLRDKERLTPLAFLPLVNCSCEKSTGRFFCPVACLLTENKAHAEIYDTGDVCYILLYPPLAFRRLCQEAVRGGFHVALSGDAK